MMDDQDFNMGQPAAAALGSGPIGAPLQVSIETTYELAFPITDATGYVITSLRLRRLKAKEMKVLNPKPSDGKFGAALQFIAVMNNLPEDVMEELDAVDVIELVGAAAPFLARGTGEPQSS